jgi:hypothetical protein
MALPTEMAQELADNAVEWVSAILVTVLVAKNVETQSVEAA